MLKSTATLIVLLAPAAAFAGTAVPVPEPGALGLLAFGAVAALYVARARRK